MADDRPHTSSDPNTMSRTDLLRQTTVDEIQEEYRRGYIFTDTRNKILREKAHLSVADSLAEHGFLKAAFVQTLKHLSDGWDNIVEAATRDISQEKGLEAGKNIRANLYYSGLAMWGQVQILGALLGSGVAEVTGQQAEEWALKAGSSPGLARVLNVAVSIGVGVLPVGKIMKGFVKGVQKVQGMESFLGLGGKQLTPGVDKLAKGMQRVGESADRAAMEAERIAYDAILEGLAVEGVTLPKAATEGATAIAKTAQQPVEFLSKLQPDLRKEFRDALKAFKSEMKDITEPQSMETASRLARELGYTLETLKAVHPQQGVSNLEMTAFLQALRPQTEKVLGLASEFLATRTEASAHALARTFMDYLTLVTKIRDLGVGAGRTVKAMDQDPRMKAIETFITEWSPEFIAKGDFLGGITLMAEDLVAIKNTPRTLEAFAIETQGKWAHFRDRIWPGIREAYINSLLSGPVSHIANVIGNSIAVANTIAERMVGAAFTADKAKGATFTDAWYLATGMKSALRDGMRAYADAFRKSGTQEGFDAISKLDFSSGAIPGVFGRIIRSPGDEMRGMDNFYKTILRSASIYKQSARMGMESGRTGKDLTEYIALRVKVPNEVMVKEAEEFALHHTFQNDLGRLGQAIRVAGNTGPAVIWFPFMKTMMNLGKYAWNRTPGLQFISKSLYDDIAKGGEAADLAIGRLTMATLQGMFVYQLAQDGMITGSGPVDPALRRAWAANHERNAVRTKAGWVPIERFDPASAPVQIVANFAQVLNHLDSPTAEQGALAATFSILKVMADSGWSNTLKQLADITGGIESGQVGDALDKVGRTLRDAPLQALGGGGLGRAIVKTIDPVTREADDVVSKIVSMIPGYSKTLPALKDPYGDPILPPQSVASEWLTQVSPLRVKPETTDPVRIEGDRLMVKIPKFPDHVGGTVRDPNDIRPPLPTDKLGTGLESDEKDRGEQLYRAALRHPQTGMEAMLNSARYKNQNDAGKGEMFLERIKAYQDVAIETLMAENPKIQARVDRSELGAELPFLGPQQQDKMKQRLELSIQKFERMAPAMRQNLLRWGDPEAEE